MAWSLRKKGGEAKHMYTTPHPRLYRQRERNRPRKRKREVLLERDERRLESEEQQKRHHETKETHGLGKGETQNGVGEKLLFEGRVPRVADDEGAEHGADTAPDPATPTVAAPAPMYLAAESISMALVDVWKERTGTTPNDEADRP